MILYYYSVIVILDVTTLSSDRSVFSLLQSICCFGLLFLKQCESFVRTYSHFKLHNFSALTLLHCKPPKALLFFTLILFLSSHLDLNGTTYIVLITINTSNM